MKTKPPCDYEGCDKPSRGKGPLSGREACRTHYGREWRSKKRGETAPTENLARSPQEGRDKPPTARKSADPAPLVVGGVYRLSYRFRLSGEVGRIIGRVVNLHYRGVVRVIEGDYKRQGQVFSPGGLNRYLDPDRIESASELQIAARPGAVSA